MIPEDITTDYLDEVADKISYEELRYLQYQRNNKYLNDVRGKIKDQVPAVQDILSQYTVNQYVEQTVKIMDGLEATFRTLIPQCMDESLDFAQSYTKNVDSYSRILARRRLSYGLIKINGERFGEPAIQGSYFDIYMADPDGFFEELKRRADHSFKLLSIHGLAEKLSEAFGAWETIVWDRMNEVDEESVGNSTRGSDKKPSAA